MTRNHRNLQSRTRKLTKQLEIELLEERLAPSAAPLAFSGPSPDVNDMVVLGSTGQSGGTQSSGTLHALSSLPQLSSLPGAKASIYLNFLGDQVANWGGYSNITVPVFSQDGDPTTFSDSELTTITNIWKYVAEDYAPFNINVTTVKPANMGHGFTQEIDIGGNGAWAGGTYGGISYIGGFSDPTLPNISFVFPSNLGNGTAKYVGDASSHEAGHAFGLYHQSLYNSQGVKVAEYYTGPGNGTAPIMGDAYYAARSMWWDGTSDISSTTIQDDMSVIASSTNGFGYRSDTTGNSRGKAIILTPSGNQVTASGIIITSSDQDYYEFTTGGGQINFSVKVPTPFNNLNAEAKLLDASGNLVATGASNGQFGATITTSVAAGTYYFVVTSDGTYGDVGQYSVSGTIVATTATVPSVPGGVSATAGDGLVALSWNSPAGATSYDLYRGTSPNGEGSTPYQTGLLSTSFTDTGLTDGVTYYYRVSAIDSAGQSGLSSEVSATPMVPVPSAPGGVTATGGPGQVSLSWNGSTGATSYNVYRATTPGGEGSTPFRTGLTATTFTDPGLSSGTTYYYQVTAVNGTGESGSSSEVSATPLPTSTAPATPTGLTANPGTGSVSLSWSVSTGATSYDIYRGTSPGGEGSTPYQTGLTTTHFTDSGLTGGTTYYYRVAAVNASGQSSLSNEVSAVPQAAQFHLAIHSGGGTVGSFLSDTDVKGGHTYATSHAIDTGGVTNPAPQAVYQTERYGNFTYTVPNLTPGATYTVKLHFAEIFWNTAGKRIFNVSINGTQVLTNFDIFATAGGEYKAIVERFTAVADSAGHIIITYTSVRDFAKSSGIEIIAGIVPGPTVHGSSDLASQVSHSGPAQSGWFESGPLVPTGFPSPKLSSINQPAGVDSVVTTWFAGHAHSTHNWLDDFVEQWQL
jgi:fibronectin type 3 domain-containing protein